MNSTNTWGIDQEKIVKEAHQDVCTAFFTNDKRLSVEKVIKQYHGLWQVEKIFEQASMIKKF